MANVLSNKFEILDLLCSGAQGEIFRVRNIQNYDENFVAKFFHKETDAIKEISILKLISHEDEAFGIPKILDHGIHRQMRYYVTRKYKMSLQDYLTKKGSLDVTQTLEVAKQLVGIFKSIH